MDFFMYLKDKKIIVIISSIILNILLIVGIAYLILNKNNNVGEEKILSYDNNISNDVKDDTFFVEVKGAVKKEGVYSVTSNNIINDVINMALGFKKDAYTKNINLSKKVSPELVIYVFTKSEYKKINKPKTIYKEILIEKPCETSTYDLSNCISNNQSEIISSDKDTTFKEENNETENINKLININTASLNELMTLPSIGEAKAKAIIKYREENTLFKSITDIKNVSGIGDALFEKIKDYIEV